MGIAHLKLFYNIWLLFDSFPSKTPQIHGVSVFFQQYRQGGRRRETLHYPIKLKFHYPLVSVTEKNSCIKIVYLIKSTTTISSLENNLTIGVLFKN